MSFRTKQLQLLKNPSFRYFIASSVAGTIASGLAYIVVMWMVLSFHPSVKATLLAMILFWLPSLIISPYAGVWVDRYDRKKLIIYAEFVRAIKFVIFGCIQLVVPGLGSLYVLLVLAGCFAALYQSLLPAFVQEMVSAEQLVYANANINVAFELGGIVGRGLITVAILSVLSTTQALFVIALLYVFSALFMFKVHRHQQKDHQSIVDPERFWQSITSGYRYLKQRSTLCWYLLVQSLIKMTIMASPILVAPYVKNILHGSSRIFGVSEALLSVGTIAGAFFWSALVNKLKTLPAMMLSSVVACAAYFCLCFASHLVFALLCFFVLGFSWGSFSLIRSAVQGLTDGAYQGRVQSLSTAVLTLVFIAFAIHAHASSGPLSAHHAFGFLAGLSVLTLLFLLYVFFCSRRPS
jgi:MFS transporter, DHA3 family, macrolide efflux protein